MTRFKGNAISAFNLKSQWSAILRGIHVLVVLTLCFLVAPSKGTAIAFTFLLGGCGIMALTTLKVMAILGRVGRRML